MAAYRGKRNEEAKGWLSRLNRNEGWKAILKRHEVTCEGANIGLKTQL
jgi:hypothetical protein